MLIEFDQINVNTNTKWWTLQYSNTQKHRILTNLQTLNRDELRLKLQMIQYYELRYAKQWVQPQDYAVEVAVNPWFFVSWSPRGHHVGTLGVPYGVPGGGPVLVEFRPALLRHLLNYVVVHVLGLRCTKGSVAAWWTSMTFYKTSHYVRFAPSVVGHLLTYLLTYVQRGSRQRIYCLSSSFALCVSVCSSFALCVSYLLRFALFVSLSSALSSLLLVRIFLVMVFVFALCVCFYSSSSLSLPSLSFRAQIARNCRATILKID